MHWSLTIHTLHRISLMAQDTEAPRAGPIRAPVLRPPGRLDHGVLCNRWSCASHISAASQSHAGPLLHPVTHTPCCCTKVDMHTYIVGGCGHSPCSQQHPHHFQASRVCCVNQGGVAILHAAALQQWQQAARHKHYPSLTRHTACRRCLPREAMVHSNAVHAVAQAASHRR
jgi:hypothetical protein